MQNAGPGMLHHRQLADVRSGPWILQELCAGSAVHLRGAGCAVLVRGQGHRVSHSRAATTIACVPVSSVGWTTGAKFAEWFTGMSWAIRPASSARR